MSKQQRNQKLLISIGKRLKYFREKKGVTQEELVNDTGINIGRIETGDINISVSTLEALCSYLEISMGEFFGKGFE